MRCALRALFAITLLEGCTPPPDAPSARRSEAHLQSQDRRCLPAYGCTGYEGCAVVEADGRVALSAPVEPDLGPWLERVCDAPAASIAPRCLEIVRVRARCIFGRKAEYPRDRERCAFSGERCEAPTSGPPAP